MNRGSVLVRICLGIAVAQSATLLCCYAFDIPLGKPGTFTYLYSPFAWERFASRGFAVGVLFACATVLAVKLALSAEAPRRAVGLAAVWSCWGAWAAWGFFAPPLFINTHAFNMISPSHDGAFLREAELIASPAAYLRAFPQRARTPAHEMKGTRVISNPPGATLLAWVTLRMLGDSQLADALLCWVTPQARELSASERTLIRRALAYAVVLQLVWLAAAPLLYLLARRWFDPPAAAMLATLTFLSPATLLFAPGKDPAQLFTVAAPLLLWVVAVRGSGLAAVAAGVACTGSLVVGLVHAWVALIALAATIWSVIGPATRTPAALRAIVRCLILAAAGGLAAALLLFIGCGLNLPAALLAAAKSQAEVTRGEQAMPAVWQLLGLPLFLLFCGPAVPALIGWLRFGRSSGGAEPCGVAAGDLDARFGDGLLIGSVLVMVGTVAFTNAEAPRLWIPFMPLLMLGAALRLSIFRGDRLLSDGAHAQANRATALTVLVAAQLAVMLVQWVIMDMREAETRLLLDPSGAARYFE